MSKKHSPLGEQSPYSLTRQELTKNEHVLLYACSEAVESKLVKLETSRTVILPPTVSVLCCEYASKQHKVECCMVRSRDAVLKDLLQNYFNHSAFLLVGIQAKYLLCHLTAVKFFKEQGQDWS